MLRLDGSPDVMPALAPQHAVEPYGEVVGDLSAFDRSVVAPLIKRFVDVAVAGVALALLLPLMLLVAAAVWAGD
ncbi:lipopolysaccharide/colanic/teichoic acid biosynthesis glycosyltransferase, partial [Methylobacterium aerolatum]|nr:lipopolysaccharide/colanic/teichoic acid biosynthesis glycosyltransferase [Methylobacterium aerolatum]